MQGEQHFRSTLGELYTYCLIPYTAGNGKLEGPDVDTEVSWELCVDATGRTNLVLSCQLPYVEMTSDGFFAKYALRGRSLDSEWEVSCESLIIVSMSAGTQQDTILTCHLADDLSLERVHTGEADVRRKLVGYILNFHQMGLGRFVCRALDRDITFSETSNANAIKDLIKSGRAPCGVLSSVEVPLHDFELQRSSGDLLDLVLSFLSLLSLNETWCPVVRTVAGNTDIRIDVSDTGWSQYHGNVLIDNLHIHNGIPKAFSSSFSTYTDLRVRLNLDPVVDMVRQAQTQVVLEMKAAALLMAYECFLTAYLKDKGEDPDTLTEYNIQQKISRANKYLRFVPAKQQGDDLRNDIRNPLFHQGNIPHMKPEDIYSTYLDYFDLLVRIILRVLNYGGMFISRTNYKPRSV